VGFSCNAQVELPESLIFDDPEAFQQRVRSVYVQCTRAVNDELARHQQGGNGQVPNAAPHRAATTGSSGNGRGERGNCSCSPMLRSRPAALMLLASDRTPWTNRIQRDLVRRSTKPRRPRCRVAGNRRATSVACLDHSADGGRGETEDRRGRERSLPKRKRLAR